MNILFLEIHPSKRLHLKKYHNIYTHGVQWEPWFCRHLRTLCRRLSVYQAPYAFGEEFRIVDDLATSSATHVHFTCAAVMCSKMVALTVAIRDTKRRPKQISIILTHMMYNESLGFVYISAPCADVWASIKLHMLLARNSGLMLTLPHPVQPMCIVHVLL